LLVFLLFIFGASFLGGGVSNVVHAGEIASNGLRVNAVVLGSAGGFSSGSYGSHALQVSYRTASGQQEQGTLDAPNLASSYRIGSAITVVYDRSDPSVVAMPETNSSGPWSQVVVGIVALLGVFAILVSTLVRARKRRSQVPATRAALDKT
jgi:hypothetical protein